MGQELVTMDERRPAIDPGVFRIKEGPCTGQYANKHTLQRIAYEAGLPVPPIIEKGDHRFSERPRWLRGYYPHPFDMWAVDMLPSMLCCGWAHWKEFNQQLTRVKDEISRSGYLRRNFGLTQVPKPDYFQQESVCAGPDDTTYVSLWTRGRETYLNCQRPPGAPGTSWLHYVDGEPLEETSHSDLFPYGGLFRDIFFPITQRAGVQFDRVLGGPYDYKHDFLLVHGINPYLIQSRVASPQISDKKMQDERACIQRLFKKFVLGKVCDIKSLDRFDAPQTPFVMTLRNTTYGDAIGGPQVLKSDFSHMAGLFLPNGLRNGMLHHNGYLVIAYALYWGIPIDFY